MSKQASSTTRRWQAPKLFVCAWCQQHGHPQAATRPCRTNLWYVVSHAFVQAVTRAGLASHGVCGRCKNRLVEDLGMPMESHRGSRAA